MKEETATYLLIERLKGTISTNDDEKLDAWLSADEGNEILAQKIERTWELSFQNEASMAVNFDANTDFKQLMAKIIEKKEETPFQIMFSRQSWLRIAAAVLFIITSGVIYWKILTKPAEMMEFATNMGEKKDITLPDGSHIWLNENTKIAYPKKWQEGIRLVTCAGEAFFEVTKDATHPFVVQTKLGEVRVIGTAFTVNHKSNSKILEIAVKEGKVAVTPDKLGKKAELVAGDAIRFDASNQTLTRLENPAGAMYAWKTGEFSFDALSLSEVSEVLGQLYNINVKINPALQSCKYSSRYTTNLPLSSIVKDICVVFGATSKMTGNEIVIEGGSCK
jgi:transmembrane sensor